MNISAISTHPTDAAAGGGLNPKAISFYDFQDCAEAFLSVSRFIICRISVLVKHSQEICWQGPAGQEA